MELPKIAFITLVALAVLVLFSGCTLPESGQLILPGTQDQPDTGQPILPDPPVQPVQPDNSANVEWQQFTSFQLSAGSPEYIDGKPVIRLYSTTWCPHCVWVKETFDQTVKSYVEQGKIVAYHWELDTGDNTLTSEVESKVPDSEVDVFYRFNPRGGVPTFVFGTKYYRVGNGYEVQKDLEAEEEEFKAVIEELIKNAPQ